MRLILYNTNNTRHHFEQLWWTYFFFQKHMLITTTKRIREKRKEKRKKEKKKERNFVDSYKPYELFIKYYYLRPKGITSSRQRHKQKTWMIFFAQTLHSK